jgi:Fe2+ transport system protein FeoA
MMQGALTTERKVTFVTLSRAIAHSRIGRMPAGIAVMVASPPIPLAHLSAGARSRVVEVPPEDADRLAAEGLHRGDTLVVEVILPLGGPVVVRLGRARVAIARRVAAGILVEPDRSP